MCVAKILRPSRLGRRSPVTDVTGGVNLKGGPVPSFMQKNVLEPIGSGTLKTCYHPDSTAGFPFSPQRPCGLQPITGPTVLPYQIRFRQKTPGPVYWGSSTGSHQPPALWGQERSAFFPSKSLTGDILLKKKRFVKGVLIGSHHNGFDHDWPVPLSDLIFSRYTARTVPISSGTLRKRVIIP